MGDNKMTEEDPPKCNHPENRGKECSRENCPIGEDYLDSLIATADGCEDMYWKGEEPHTKYVKCKDCKHCAVRANEFVCQVTDLTIEPHAELECSEYKEKEGEPTIKRYWGDNPDEMTDDELIAASIYFDEAWQPPPSLFQRYYQDYLWGEIKRRGITDKQIEEGYG